MYPQLEETKSVLPPGSFVTCSSDNTIRIWNIDPHQGQDVKRNIYSQVGGPSMIIGLRTFTLKPIGNDSSLQTCTCVHYVFCPYFVLLSINHLLTNFLIRYYNECIMYIYV